MEIQREQTMKTAATLMAGATLALMASAANACERPAAPTVLDGVDGARMPVEQLVAAQKEVAGFIAASDAFQACVVDDLAAKRAAAKEAKTKVDPAVVKAANAQLDANQADKERVGGQFNAAAKAYKAAHPS